MSNYEVWKLARNPSSGIYIDHTKLTVNDLSKQDWDQGSTGVTGLGLVMECLARQLTNLTPEDYKSRVL